MLQEISIKVKKGEEELDDSHQNPEEINCAHFPTSFDLIAAMNYQFRQERFQVKRKMAQQ